jgi:hypothetical protein
MLTDRAYQLTLQQQAIVYQVRRCANPRHLIL